ncbi:MAG: SGNH/GDSL hydrolase family protein [Oligoflexia bacterium]|nr:SGNH/GDSL hydrolase family protein [Oligoflexia bacterium]
MWLRKLRPSGLSLAWKFLLVATLLGTARPSGAADERPLLMVVLGDSISAGTLSDIPIPRGPDAIRNVVQWYTEGQEASAIIENKVRYSWASGNRIRSQYALLKAYLRRRGEKRRLEVLNVSVPGAQTADLPEQAEQVVEAMQSGKYSAIVYLTLLIGSNDACSKHYDGGVPVPKMRASLVRTFEILSRALNGTRLPVLLVGIPRIPDLGEDRIRNGPTLFGLSCERVRNRILKLCNPLLMWESWDEYDRNMLVVEERNRMFRLFTDELNQRLPEFDVFYTNRLYNLEIPREILAADCFHPNRFGQEIISLQVWDDQPWFKERKPTR